MKKLLLLLSPLAIDWAKNQEDVAALLRQRGAPDGKAATTSARPDSNIIAVTLRI
jgi:hypothetical protein